MCCGFHAELIKLCLKRADVAVLIVSDTLFLKSSCIFLLLLVH